MKLNKKLSSLFHHNISRKMAVIPGYDNPWALLSPDALLKHCNIPGLLVYDQSDEEIPRQVFEEIEQHWTRGQVIKTQGLGHSRLLKDTEVIKQVVIYLAGSKTKAP